MSTSMFSADSHSGGSHAQRAVAIHKLVETTDQMRLRKQVVWSSATAIVSLVCTVAVFLFMLFGPALAEQAAVFTVFLLAVSASMFLVSVFALATPMLDVLTFHKLASLQKDMECCELQERNQQLVRILREAVESDDPRSVLQSYREPIESLTADRPEALV